MRRFLHLALLAAFLLAAALPAPAATKSKKRVAPTADSDDNPYAQILPVGVPSVRAASVVVIDAKTGEQKLLQPGVDYALEFVRKRTQRCQICDRTFPASEIIIRNGEQLCVWCHMDKYPLTEQDIPF